MSRRFTHIWAWPIILAFLTVFGLLSALLGTGIWHWLSWAALSVPLILIGYYWQIKKTK